MNFNKNLLLLFICASILSSCMHDSLVVQDPDITDPDPNAPGKPCDTDTIYFVNDILPIIKSNCAFSGCHGDGSIQDGVDLSSYEKIINTADVRPFRPDNSDLYEVITEDDDDKMMPPPPANRLTSEQIAKIKKWINQGALNNSCSQCETETVTFSGTISSIIQNNCQGCHSGGNPSGGITMTNYNQIKTQVDNGALIGAVTHSNGFVPMPYNQPRLNDCKLDQIQIWISSGAPNN